MGEGKTTEEIRQILAGTPAKHLAEQISVYQQDKRASVQKLLAVYERKYRAFLTEQDRLLAMRTYENYYANQGIQWIAGVDEVGRGPLAGPVVAAAVILPKDCMIPGVNDSKKLSPSQRETLSAAIRDQALSIGLGTVSSQIIDEINIRRATFMAMQKALASLDPPPEAVLVDGEAIPGLAIPQQAIIKGDQKSFSIAAASIIAKVARDTMMQEYDSVYPGYGFAENKGYGTPAHIAAIKAMGVSPIHRRSFTRSFI